jgi:succinate-semialdehyde dehydrogenase/glutarate-semialdehyde dehydrogenase
MNTLKCLNSNTGKLIEELEIATSQQIKEMVKKSKIAQKKWAKLSIDQRCNYIRKAYDLINQNIEEFSKLIHDEMGKTIDEAKGEIKVYSSGLENMISEVKEALAPHSKTVDGVTTTTYYDPYGVCASITPWNFPMGMPHTLMMPTLMAGNTILFKPSEEAVLIGLRYAQYLNEFLPEGVLQVVIGTGEQGKELVESDIQLITFTGSQATGKNILETGARDLKRVILELGGKDPLIVMDDADVDKVAKFAAINSFRNCGQVCVSTEKILVTERNHDALVEKLANRAKKFRVGAMINLKQKSHVLKQIKQALDKGAKMVVGDIENHQGNFLNPIVLTNVSRDMNIMIDETFGPVACITKVNDMDEAVEIANEGNYALGAVVFGENLEKAQKIGRQLNAGMIGINKSCGGVKGSPWIGAGQSGYNFHGSKFGHRMFTQMRILTIEN